MKIPYIFIPGRFWDKFREDGVNGSPLGRYSDFDNECDEKFAQERIARANDVWQAKEEGRIRFEMMRNSDSRKWLRGYMVDEEGNEIRNLGGV